MVLFIGCQIILVLNYSKNVRAVNIIPTFQRDKTLCLQSTQYRKIDTGKFLLYNKNA